MSVDVAESLRLKRRTGKPSPVNPSTKPRRKISTNGLIGVGLWLLLWLGYNTDIGRVMRPGFPSDSVDLIHGIRAFFPMLAAWLALLLIFFRSGRLMPYIMGPVGLMLLYDVTGLASSATLSIEPIYAMYYGINYLAIVLVMLAVVMVDDPLPDLRWVLRLTWTVGTMLTFGLLGAIPILGSAAIVKEEASPSGMRAYNGAGSIMGMATTRNTGFARYAAISALVALPGLMRKSRPAVRVMWGVVFAASIYALYIANGRTEILAFVLGAALILGAEKAKRFINFLAAACAAILLGLRGFFSEFFLYFTRTGKIDFTMTGRTAIWADGAAILKKSPWVGFGFQADRLYVGAHLHNAFLHVFVQSGLLGGGAILIGLAIVWFYLIKYFFLRKPADRSLIPPEIPAVFLFVTVSSITESTFAYFSAAWLLSAPIVAYVLALHKQMHQASMIAVKEMWRRQRLSREQLREADAPDMEGLRPSPLRRRTRS